MSKEYIFEFQGTKEMFLKKLFPNNNDKYYYFNDYIVKLIDNEIHFGVERCGHSGGNWFIPKITEFDNRIEFRGKIQYVGPNYDQSKLQKAIDKIGEALLFVLLIPVFLIFWIYAFVEWCIRKIFRRTKPKLNTTEDKLYDLMETHLSCTRL